MQMHAVSFVSKGIGFQRMTPKALSDGKEYQRPNASKGINPNEPFDITFTVQR
jgi:hypothetical protein